MTRMLGKALLLALVAVTLAWSTARAEVGLEVREVDAAYLEAGGPDTLPDGMAKVEWVARWLDKHPNLDEYLDQHPRVAEAMAEHPRAAVAFYRHPHAARWLAKHPDLRVRVEAAHDRWERASPAQREQLLQGWGRHRGNKLERQGDRMQERGEALQEDGHPKAGKALEKKGERRERKGERVQRRGR